MATRDDVLARRRVDVDGVDRLGAGRDLVHVDGRAGEEHRPALGDGDHRDRVRLALGRQARPFERVDRDVHGRPVAVADLLAVEEHRRLVLLALADHDDAVHRDRVEHYAHPVDRGLVGGLLVAPADPPARAERGGLRHADELEREIAVRAVPGTSLLDGRLRHRPRSYIRSGASTPTRSRQRAITVCVARQSAEPERLRLALEHAVVVVEAVEVVRDADRVRRDRLRPAPLRRLGDDRREARRAA